MYESGQGWANPWHVFLRAPSRSGRGRLATVDVVVCFDCGRIVFSSQFPYFEPTRPAASTRPPCLIYLSTSNAAIFCLLGKKPLHTGMYSMAVFH